MRIKKHRWSRCCCWIAAAETLCSLNLFFEIKLTMVKKKQDLAGTSCLLSTRQANYATWNRLSNFYATVLAMLPSAEAAGCRNLIT